MHFLTKNKTSLQNNKNLNKKKRQQNNNQTKSNKISEYYINSIFYLLNLQEEVSVVFVELAITIPVKLTIAGILLELHAAEGICWNIENYGKSLKVWTSTPSSKFGAS